MKLAIYTGYRSFGGDKWRALYYIAPAGLDVDRARASRLSVYYVNLDKARQVLAELQSKYDDVDAAG